MKRVLVTALLVGCATAPPPVEPRLQRLQTPTTSERSSPSAPPLAFGENIPAYGCLGISAAHDVVACAVGVSGTGMGGVSTRVTLAFAALAPDVEAADSIMLLDDRGEIPDPERVRLEPTTRAQVEKALAGFVRWEPASKLSGRGHLAVHDMQIRVTQALVSPGGDDGAPRYDASLEIRARGRTQLVDEVHGEPLSRYEVRVFETRDGVVLERTKRTADEGSYITTVDAWTCRGASCDDI